MYVILRNGLEVSRGNKSRSSALETLTEIVRKEALGILSAKPRIVYNNVSPEAVLYVYNCPLVTYNVSLETTLANASETP